MCVTVIGIDCATKSRKTGLALGWFDNDEVYVQRTLIGSRRPPVAETVADWINQSADTLIALDAPLGWPIDLGQVLKDHQAGEAVSVKPNIMFRRQTDRIVKDKIGKQPLDVGADKIARTAHAALTLLQEIRERTGARIPLVWHPADIASACAIEVYPAATSLAYGFETKGYKAKKGQTARKRMIQQLYPHVRFSTDTTLTEVNDDIIDAILCVLAGVDFLRGDVIEPQDLNTAKQEGWIWVKKPSQ